MLARQRRGAISAASAPAVGSSPPMPTPATRRSTSTCARLPASAVAQVTAPNSRLAAMIARLRPRWSPIQPKISAPNRMPTRLALSTGPIAAIEVTPNSRIMPGAAKAMAAMS